MSRRTFLVWLLVILATFYGLPASAWHTEIAERGMWAWVHHHLLTFAGLEDLIHIDTMLFILGLTLFVSVIAQTRVLEGITFFLLRRNGGRILPTVIAVTAVVAITSGMLGGVSMIGLTIRTFVIILMLGAAPLGAIRYAVMVCTAVTTCRVSTSALNTTAREATNGTSTSRARASVSGRSVKLERGE